MTLKSWCEKTDILATHPTTETAELSVVIDQTDANRSHLWKLSDYIVTSVAGLVIWLSPRIKPAEQFSVGSYIESVTTHIAYPDEYIGTGNVYKIVGREPFNGRLIVWQIANGKTMNKTHLHPTVKCWRVTNDGDWP